MQTLETLEIAPSGDIESAVIWLHGLGADGYDFKPVVEMLGLPTTRFILPHAPERPVTLNHGYSMPAWYDIFGLEASSRQDEAGIEASRLQIEDLIARELSRGVPAERIALAGFSQGGALALHTALRYSQRLAGIVALSTYLPLKNTLEDQAHTVNIDIPIFLAHGTFDNVITLQTNQLSKEVLEAAGYPLEWHEYPIAHSVCEQEIDDIRVFLKKVLSVA